MVVPFGSLNFRTLPIPGIESLLSSFVYALVGQLPTHVGEVRIRPHFERQPGALRARAPVKPDHELPDLAREEGAVVLAFGQHQSVHLGVVVDGPIKIGRLERRVADASCLDHGVLLRKAPRFS